jgi:DNA-binding MarR family transcriptional regulator
MFLLSPKSRNALGRLHLVSALLAKKMRPTMARLTLARKMGMFFEESKCRATIYIGASELRRTNLTTQDYEALAELRHQIRHFVRFSEEVSRNTGLKPQQHQLMLTLKGLPEGTRPCVGEMAQRLQIKHHSAVELIDRLVAGGYVRRNRGAADRREVLLTLARKGENVL